MPVAATNRSAAFSAGDPNFAARSFALKKKKKNRKKKKQRKAQGLESEARGSRCNRSPSPVRAHRVSAEPVGIPETPPEAGQTPGAEALGGAEPLLVAAALAAGHPLAVPPPPPPAARGDLQAAISKHCPARRRARRGGSGLARPPRHAAGRVSRRGLRSPQVPAGAPGPAGEGGAALAMLRGPRALAPAAGPPPKGLPTMSPTELWPPGLSSPQLCPATTTYYTQLYPQTVPPAAAPGTCLDATPHGPEGQAVRCVPAGRLPVMLGTPPAPAPLPSLLLRVWERREGRLGASLSEAGRVWGGRRGAFSFQNSPLPQYLSRRAFHFQTWDEITSSTGVEWNERWIRSVETQRPTPSAPCDLGEVYRVNLLSFIHSFIHCLAQKPVLGTCYCPSTELSLGIPWEL